MARNSPSASKRSAGQAMASRMSPNPRQTIRKRPPRPLSPSFTRAAERLREANEDLHCRARATAVAEVQIFSVATLEKKMRVRPNSHLIGCRLRVMLIFGESHPGFFLGTSLLHRMHDPRARCRLSDGKFLVGVEGERLR